MTARAQAAVAGVRTEGIVFTIIGSWPPRDVCMLPEPLGIKSPHAGFNGGVVTRRDLTVINECLLAPEFARQAVEALDAQG